MDSSPLLLHNQAQPEPNLVIADALNAALNSSNEPNLASIEASNLPLGLELPESAGDIDSQKKQ